MQHTLAKISGLSQKYDQNPSPTYSNLSFDILSGEVLGIAARSGVGKTTLLSNLGLLLPFSGGKIEYFFQGQGITVCSRTDRKKWKEIRKENFGFIFQRPYTIAHFDILSNIFLPLWIKGLSPNMIAPFSTQQQTYHDILQDWAKALGLSQELPEVFENGSHQFKRLLFHNKKPSELSVGQLSRVSVLRGLLHGPQLIFADEPTASVGHELADSILDLVRSYLAITREKSQQTPHYASSALVLVSHDNDLLAKYSNRILLLHPHQANPSSILSRNGQTTDQFLATLLQYRQEKQA